MFYNHVSRPVRDNPPPAAPPASAPSRKRGPDNRRDTRYRCPACGEFLIYKERRCASCNEESPVYNRPAFWRWFYAILLSGIAVVAYQMLS